MVATTKQQNLIETTSTSSKGFVPKDFFINVTVQFTDSAGNTEIFTPKAGIGVNWSDLSPELADTLKGKSLGKVGTASQALSECFSVEITRITLAQKQVKETDKAKQKALAANTPD